MDRPFRPPLPNLTSLRFVAALMVFLHHTRDFYPWPHWPWLQTLLHAGFTGVSLFFVLSGFILAYNYESVPNPARFYLSRFARIYPLYLFALLLAVPFAIHHTGLRFTGVALLANLLLLQTWSPRLVESINTPGWTLSVEALFYALFPLLLAPLSRVRRSGLWIAVLWFLAILPGFALHFGLARFNPATVPAITPWLHTPPFRVCEFVIGVLLGIRFRRRQPRSGSAAALALVALSLALLLSEPLWPFESFRDGLLALPFGLLIYTLAGLPSRLLSWAPLQLAGESSYALYIVQFPFFGAVDFALRHTRWATWIHPLLLFLFPISFVLYRFLEVPSRNAILNRFRIPHRPKPEPTTNPTLP